jgi:hypothetical protein
MKNENLGSENLSQKMVKGLEISSVRLLDEKRAKGQKLVVMIDGKVIELTVEEYEFMKAEGRI